MRKVVITFFAVILVAVPAMASAAVRKSARATGRMVSQGCTSNSVSVKVNNAGQIQRNQRFQASTGSAGIVDVTGELDGDEPAVITVIGAGRGLANAGGRNQASYKNVWLPEIRGVSNSANEVVSQIQLVIE